MPLAPAKFVPQEQKTSIVKIFSYDGRSIAGTIGNKLYAEEITFMNTGQFIFAIDDLQNDLSFPQENMQRRKFSGANGASQPTSKAPQQNFTGNPLATFKVAVMFRQNASWQGSVTWVEKEMESPFRSALELLILLDSVLG